MKKIFWLYLMVIGLVMVWYIPPFQKADEILHFKNVAVLIGGQTRMIQGRFGELPIKLRSKDIAFNYDKKINNNRLWEKDENSTLQPFGFEVNLKNHISYFPLQIGGWIGSWWPYPVMSVYLGRMFGLILFGICIWLSLWIIPKKYSGIVMAYALIPMVIHQVTEVSYDVLLLCLAPLILAVFLKTLKAQLWRRWLGLLTFLILLFVLIKSGYYLMFFLMPIILWNKYKDKLVDKPWIIGIVILALVPLLIYFFRFLGNNVNSGNTGLVNGAYQLEIIKHDPWQLWRIIGDTWIAKRDFYIKGMVGYFGWLDYEFDLNQYLLVMGIIVIILTNIIFKIKKPIVGWLGWMLVGLTILGTYLLIEVGFLMQWTGVGVGIIEGVQGRYLLPIIPLLFFWITQTFGLLGKERTKFLLFLVVLIGLITGMIDKIFYRYYDLSANFKNKNEIVMQLQDANEQKLEKTLFSSKNKLVVNFHLSEGDRLGGFEMAIERGEDKIIAPYRYSIKDIECTREISWGYLDNTILNKESIYFQSFDELRLGYRDICFEIESIIKDTNQTYFDYVLIDEEPLVRLLFISDEIK